MIISKIHYNRSLFLLDTYMKKAILLWWILLTLYGTTCINANTIFIENDNNTSIWDSLFVDENNTIDTKVTNKDTWVSKSNNTEKIDSNNWNLEYELAKKFVTKYSLFSFEDTDEHNIMEDKNFLAATSHFINLTLWGRTNIINDLETTRYNFMILLWRSLAKECNNEECIISFIKENNISTLDSDQNNRKITNYEATLLLWRSYLQYKSKYYDDNALGGKQININNILSSNRFNDYELLQYSNNRNTYYQESIKKGYGNFTCYYNTENDIKMVVCSKGNDTYPFYSLEDISNSSSIQELLRLSTSSNELFLSQTSYY